MTSFAEGDSEPATLTIGEVASRTGLTVANLRNWEIRYGIPTPDRSAGGQRRYRERDCRLIAEIVRRRDGGMALNAAVRQAQDAAGSGGDNSIYQAVRRYRPDLPVHRMDKGLLLTLTRAMEDQCCSAADQPILIGAFQRTRFFESARRRWESMAATSDRTIVFADFGGSSRRTRGVFKVALDDSSPLNREWALISDSQAMPACLLAWEPPGQEHLPDRRRAFEMIWSVSPDVVRQATRAGVRIATRSTPELGPHLADRLAEAAPVASPDLARASAVLERTIDYLARDRRSAD